MMKNFVNLLVYFVSFSLLSSLINCEISDKRLCADAECKTLLSLAKTLVNYQASEHGALSFQINKEARVYSKSAGSRPEMWGVEIQGQRGYANKNMLREHRVLVKKAEITYEVPTNLEELRQKELERKQAKLKSSQPEEAIVEQTTTSPLPDQLNDNIVTDHADVNSSTEKPNGSPVQDKIEVVDGTTVLVSEPEQVQNEFAPVEADSEEDDEITVEEEDAEETESEEVHENDAKAQEEPVKAVETNDLPEQKLEQVSEQVNASSEESVNIPDAQLQQINVSVDDEIPPFKPVPYSAAVFASEALSNEYSAQELPNTFSDNVKPVTEDVDESMPYEETMNPTASPNSLTATEPEVDLEKEEQINGTASSDSLTSSEEVPDHETNSTAAQENPVSTEEAAQPKVESEQEEQINGTASTDSPPSSEEVIEPQEHEVNSTATQDNPKSTEEAAELKIESPKVTETITNDEVPESNLTQSQEHENQTGNEFLDSEEQLPATTEEEKTEQPEEKLPEKHEENVVDPMEVPTTLPLSQYPTTPVPEPVERDSEVPQYPTKSEQLNEGVHDHDHHHHHHDHHHHDHDHHHHDHEHSPKHNDLASETIQQQNVESSPPVTELPPNIESTTNGYDNDFNIPNPLHDEAATTLADAELTTAASPQLEDTTEKSVPHVENEPQPSNKAVEVPTTETSSTSIPSESSEQVESEPIPAIGVPGIVTPVEPVQPASDHEQIATENNKGLFDTILGTVNSFWSNSKTPEEKIHESFDDALDKVLFPDKEKADEEQPKAVDDGYCENLSPNACPEKPPKYSHQSNGLNVQTAGARQGSEHASVNKECINGNYFLSQVANKLLEMTDFIICLGITALTILIFTFGHYCISNGRKENSLVSKLNIVERSLLASTKEVDILKHDLIETRNKLVSIEDNSFGSNDMVIALRKDLDESEMEKEKLQEQVASLEKELENAAEAGLELNKIVSELLNNQSGDDSIISSVEELQKQLNEQQNTILEINTTLAEKSRENSELQMLISEISGKFQEEIDELKSQNETISNHRNALQTQVDDAKSIFEVELSKMMAQKNDEIEKLVKDLSAQAAKFDEINRKYQAREARVEALEENLDSVKKNPNINMKDLLKATENKTEVLSVKKERDSLKERLEGEMDARKLLEDHVKIVSEEVSALKQEYNQSEKEKLEAQTRLEVLSSYFKEKETQLQKELSVKEAMWMKQQGETTSTVERVRLMQDEIQALKSQNDSLRAEIEAQTAAHKAQIASLENRAHETWLASRQSDRKLEEARSEATALRRKLTSIAGIPMSNDTGLPSRIQNSVDGMPNHDLNQAPSPIHMDSPGSPLLGGLPPPPPFLPPPFMGPPHPFMSMPPPFMPPGEMRPPPLGRLMSPPPPPPNRYSPSLVDDRDRYSPENGRYSPDSRYQYNTDIISTYDTETDFSPPPSPHGRSRDGGGSYSSRERERDRRNYKSFSPPPNSDRSKKTKGVVSSGSADSFDSRKAKGRGRGKGKANA